MWDLDQKLDQPMDEEAGKLKNAYREKAKANEEEEAMVKVYGKPYEETMLLVEWTRDKNLIVSSFAPFIHELRGPNDVANLVSLIGLSNEFAKVTISKNFRLLIANALRKKLFYREAIRIEEMPLGIQTDPKEPWIVDDIDWDPLSSGEDSSIFPNLSLGVGLQELKEDLEK
ncbi:unnamed protein product [Amaranthus hypochondriacus]